MSAWSRNERRSGRSERRATDLLLEGLERLERRHLGVGESLRLELIDGSVVGIVDVDERDRGGKRLLRNGAGDLDGRGGLRGLSGGESWSGAKKVMREYIKREAHSAGKREEAPGGLDEGGEEVVESRPRGGGGEKHRGESGGEDEKGEQLWMQA